MASAISSGLKSRKSVSTMHDDWRSNGGCVSAMLAIKDDAIKMKRMQRFIGNVNTTDSLLPCLMACMDSSDDGNFHCGCQHVR